jgi:hypothetical protein
LSLLREEYYGVKTAQSTILSPNLEDGFLGIFILHLSHHFTTTISAINPELPKSP